MGGDADLDLLDDPNDDRSLARSRSMISSLSCLYNTAEYSSQYLDVTLYAVIDDLKDHNHSGLI